MVSGGVHVHAAHPHALDLVKYRIFVLKTQVFGAFDLEQFDNRHKTVAQNQTNRYMLHHSRGP